MKIAIVHDVFIEFGGAERVLLALLDMYPAADVYVPLLSKERKEEVASHTTGKIVTSWLNNLPFIHSASLLLKPLLYLYWEQVDLKGYDFVISSSHSFSSKSVIVGPGTKHVSYIHTPPRYLYTEFNETQILRTPILRTILSPLLSWLRVRDFIGAQRPDVLIANSKHVQKRILKYYRRDSVVVYPPVTIPKKIPNRKPQYYVCVSRLARQKGMDLAIKTCNTLRERLVIVGEGSQEAFLRSIAGPTIEFWGKVPDEKMAGVWAGAKALIYPSIEEDFGIVPVEAMAHGVPVIAYDSGALRESVVDGKTGIFFSEFTMHALQRAISQLNVLPWSSASLRAHARKFSEKAFIENIKTAVIRV